MFPVNSLGKVPPNELQIYTWMDASLKELMSLVREVNPESRKKGTYFDFAIISPSMGRGGNFHNGERCDYISRDIGTTVSGNFSKKFYFNEIARTYTYNTIQLYKKPFLQASMACSI